jgi:hypothetical protein
MAVYMSFNSDVAIHIQVDAQHLFRITPQELRQIIAQALILGGRDLREDIKRWLSDENVEQIASHLAPEKAEPSPKKIKMCDSQIKV